MNIFLSPHMVIKSFDLETSLSFDYNGDIDTSLYDKLDYLNAQLLTSFSQVDLATFTRGAIVQDKMVRNQEC